MSKIEEKFGKITIDEIELESGRKFGPVVQVYATYGKLNPQKSNVILVCHALTGSHHAAGEDVKGLPSAWWDPIIGPGKALDTNRFFVICINVLGSCYGSTGPASLNPKTNKPYAMSFPVITIRDMVKAQYITLKKLGIPKLAMVVGGSLGGMQALEWAIMYPKFVERTVVIAAPARLYPQAIAFNEVQRRAIMSDPDWKNGNYYPDKGPVRGLAVARMLGMITYRSEGCFISRWMREPADGNLYDWNGRFKVETYLHYHGEEIVKRFDANSYLYLSRAMDLHDIGEKRGGIEKAISRIKSKLLAVGISSDMLFPYWQVEEVARTAKILGLKAKYDEIVSNNGHDAFLIDFDQVDDILRNFMLETNML